MILTDESMMPTGQYKNKRKMANVPASYLLWLWEAQGETKPFGEAAQAVQAYTTENLDALKKETGR